MSEYFRSEMIEGELLCSGKKNFSPHEAQNVAIINCLSGDLFVVKAMNKFRYEILCLVLELMVKKERAKAPSSSRPKEFP